ncbi:hypothetical protein T4A_3604 [Trichinella pseudospiralis]|uniref:Uncharacterized protein n=1 Tax=Trichinella pseudospiralis TaxID=6337 RepID=A0A0V1EHA2_TRIPS|nr:hypothetical protein T4A_3604 [Trichinella pseudospiralis]
MDLILASNMRKKDSKMAIVIHELEFAWGLSISVPLHFIAFSFSLQHSRTVSLSLPSLPPLQFSPLKVRVSSGILSAMKRHQGGNHLAELATGPSICPPCICSRQRLHHVHYAAFDRKTVPSTGTFVVRTCLNHFSSSSSISGNFPLRIHLRVLEFPSLQADSKHEQHQHKATVAWSHSATLNHVQYDFVFATCNGFFVYGLPNVITDCLLRDCYINGVGISENQRTKRESVLSGNVKKECHGSMHTNLDVNAVLSSASHADDNAMPLRHNYAMRSYPIKPRFFANQQNISPENFTQRNYPAANNVKLSVKSTDHCADEGTIPNWFQHPFIIQIFASIWLCDTACSAQCETATSAMKDSVLCWLAGTEALKPG